jgi:hypothetical protein
MISHILPMNSWDDRGRDGMWGLSYQCIMQQQGMVHA